MDYKVELKPYIERAIETRRYLHAHPELSFKEEKTSAFLREQLSAMDVEFEDKYEGYAIVGYVNGTQDGPTIMLRADFDALPVKEDNDLPYKSTCDGVMHACGHDAHAATLLEVVRFFCDHKDLVKGRIKFIFQDGEELLPGGAVRLCEQGVMDNVDESYAYHVASLLPIGQVGLCRGAATAAVGAYRIAIKGHGGHGGFPYLSKNPTTCAAAITNAINQLVTTHVDPLKSAVITTAYILAGTDNIPNVIPGECVMGGNIRSLDNDVRAQLCEDVKRIADGICAAYECEWDCKILLGYPATIIGDAQYDVMAAVCDDMGLVNGNDKPQMGAEDYAYFTLEKPCCYIQIGMNDESAGPVPIPHHNAKFTIDDVRGLPIAIEFMIRTYLKALEK
ncbi:MAG: amidohydrolase [Eggerthellaceae bacterium]|nr:amidohydrolase [Eggerthellaceae bacterium]